MQREANTRKAREASTNGSCAFMGERTAVGGGAGRSGREVRTGDSCGAASTGGRTVGVEAG